MPFLSGEVKSEENEGAGGCLATVLALSGQEGLRKQLLGLRQVTLQSFFSITHCPSTLSLPQPGRYHAPRRNFLLIPNLNLPSFILKPFSLVPSLHTVVSSSLLVCVDLWAAGSSSLSKHTWCAPQKHRSGHTGSHLQPGTFSPTPPGGKAELPPGQERPVPFMPLLLGAPFFSPVASVISPLTRDES